MVDSINGEGTWASSKEWVGDMTVAEARNLTGTIIRPFPKEINVIKADPNIKVPDSFDSREQWPNCINPIMN